jgi:hypothetical protein
MSEALCRLMHVVLIFASAIAALMIMLGGLRYVNAGDDLEVSSAAKKMVLYSIVGLVIIILACPIVEYLMAVTNMPFMQSCNCYSGPALPGYFMTTSTIPARACLDNTPFGQCSSTDLWKGYMCVGSPTNPKLRPDSSCGPFLRPR